LRKDGIVLSVHLDHNLLPISAIGQEIEQVFLNIINNSRYALNEKYPYGGDSKRLDIDVRNVSKGNSIMVRACFTDYGTGIPVHLIEKVVNPFFSTKPTGQGTGLGLTISHKIVKNHSGEISIDSVTGEYTKVVVEFPAQYVHAN